MASVETRLKALMIVALASDAAAFGEGLAILGERPRGHTRRRLEPGAADVENLVTWYSVGVTICAAIGAFPGAHLLKW